MRARSEDATSATQIRVRYVNIPRVIPARNNKPGRRYYNAQVSYSPLPFPYLSGRGLVVYRMLDSGLQGRGFDAHTGHGSLLKLRQFHLPRFASVYSAVPTLLGRYLLWTSVLSRRVSTTALKLIALNETRFKHWPSLAFMAYLRLGMNLPFFTFSLFEVGASSFHSPSSPVLCFFSLYSCLLHVFCTSVSVFLSFGVH